ncbi:2-dehydro-3-deoxygalactonokinase [Pseudooceanicola atlanticus]|uniref:2-dehydro-3-deoxygalactonokinase n=1 Tax=Pseudooceanicola atlanticus TaxID=1461694 RepID=UPI0005C1F603|nr:2-dehydro-3-deoxygalactonokinase [Pseudooceanicola atlanticus]
MTAWIAVDWGTSRLRLWAMDADGEVIATATSEAGMGRLSPPEFEPAFLAAAGDLVPDIGEVEVLICGMAGARTGWQEVSYTAVPCAPVTWPEAIAATDPRLSVRIIPGLSQSAPPDVMRGEETQIAGFLSDHPDHDGVICLPGTHTKWVRVADGQVESFRTAMTGELFELLSARSTLASFTAEGWDDTAFDDACAEAMQSTEALAADLFGLRAAALLDGFRPGAARGRLSGLLIGHEVAALRDLWRDRPVALVGDDRLVDLYRRALQAAGQGAESFGAEALTLRGLRLAHHHFGKDAS